MPSSSGWAEGSRITDHPGRSDRTWASSRSPFSVFTFSPPPSLATTGRRRRPWTTRGLSAPLNVELISLRDPSRQGPPLPARADRA